jgi:OmpA-OmpF porin, OOP family
MATDRSSFLDDDIDANTALAKQKEDDRTEAFAAWGGVTFALVVVIGLLANALGVFGGPDKAWTAALSSFVKDDSPQPSRALLAGLVATTAMKSDFENVVKKAFPKATIDNRLRVDGKMKPERSEAMLQVTEKFGDVRNFMFAWRGGKFSYDGRFYTQQPIDDLRKLYDGLDEKSRGEFTCRLSERPAVDPAQLTKEIAAFLEGKVIEFDTGTSTLTPAGVAVLDGLAPRLQTLTGLMVDVQGHTDTDGDALANVELSRNRATAVIQYLATKNADIKRFKSTGLGGTRPKAPNDTPEGKQLNRRVELIAKEME